MPDAQVPATIPRSDAIVAHCNQMKEQLERALPKHIPPEALTRAFITAMRKNPVLFECERVTIYASLMQAGQLGLIVDGVLGHGHLVPFKNKRGGRDCVFIPGYRGYEELAMRSGKVAHIRANVVREKDPFTYREGAHPILEHEKLINQDAGERIGAYAIAHLIAAPTQPAFRFLDARRIEAVKARAPGSRKKDSPWNGTKNGQPDDEDAMWCKTAIIALCKHLQLSPELTRAASLGDQYDAGLGEARTIDLSKAGRSGFDLSPRHVDVESEPADEPEEPQDPPQDAETPPDSLGDDASIGRLFPDE
jgi:recombination protein RecT